MMPNKLTTQCLYPAYTMLIKVQISEFKISFIFKWPFTLDKFPRDIWLSEKYYLHTLQPFIRPKQSIKID